MSIKQRKKDHVDLAVGDGAGYLKTSGFERYEFIHNSLPEIDMRDVSTEAEFFGRSFSFPLFISSMTGGYAEAGSLNAMIAEFCENCNLPFGVGSQRIMLERSEERRSFSVVRKKAPNAFIAANIGGTQLAGTVSIKDIEILIETIRADAVIVHLNPLQELMQAEGDRDFRGIKEGIANLVAGAGLPVIVKETGAGISVNSARALLECGVNAVDVAGAGGTSWSRVENLRMDPEAPYNRFDNWGIPTSDCVTGVAGLKREYEFELIASGGIRNSFDIGKALAMGADFTATAQPVIRALKQGGVEELGRMFDDWKDDLTKILTLLGCRSVAELEPGHLWKT